ncbi:Bug family tripartite tricarboxylate transporter substrate binding protein [Falsiroseomonas oryzae]|uniref:Bug family tripartite tricarboxylate transporter substrate binding protein n=1 Tax=Falsiroseomonas oryzae TaxID=2766473 RepID=UPI0022EBA24E|nr:tripartite tricarboxylate transporter substrate binding protein [Roseomonas sp. MO-31]
MRRRALLAAAPALLAAPALGQPAPWPNRPVRFINPFTAGSAVDVVTRLVATDMQDRLGSPVLVENRTGASGNIGTEAVARAPADGTTLLVGSPGTMGINPFLFRTLPYDAVRDFVGVSHAVSFPQVMVVSPQSPIRSLADLVAAAKARPGALNYASSGNGTTSHLAFELIRAATGIEIVHVPFRGGTPAIQAVMQNEVQVALEGIPSLPGFLSAGQLRPIAVTSRERSPKLPDVPAVSELVPGFDASAWVIYFAPAGTPAPLVERLSAEIATSLNRPGVRDRLLDQGATVVGADPAATAAFHRAELEKWQRAVQLSGARVE